VWGRRRAWRDEVMAEGEGDGGEADSWDEVDLGPFLGDGAADPVLPSSLARSDGGHIGYQAAIHWVWGKPGAGKTMVALVWAAQELKASRHVIWIDLENQAKGNVGRLLGPMGCVGDDVKKYFHLIQPSDPFGAAAREKLLALIEAHSPSLVVLDAMNDLITLQGGQHNDVQATSQVDQMLLQPCVKAGAAVCVLDHMRKDSESHGWPANSGHKKAVATVGIEVEQAVPFARDEAGYSTLTCYKDRNGTFTERDVIAYLEVRSGSAWLSAAPLSAVPDGAGVGEEADRRAARRMCILTLVLAEPGVYTQRSLGVELARRYHKEGQRDGFSKGTFDRQVADMLTCKDAVLIQQKDKTIIMSHSNHESPDESPDVE
jgi:hypothetical protein